MCNADWETHFLDRKWGHKVTFINLWIILHSLWCLLAKTTVAYKGIRMDGVSAFPALLLVNQTRAECGRGKTARAQTVIMWCSGKCSGTVCMCAHARVCMCLRVQVHPLPVARATLAPFSYPVELTWGSPSAFQELLLSFNRLLMQAHYRSLGPLVWEGGQRAAKGINWKVRNLMRTGKTLSLVK